MFMLIFEQPSLCLFFLYQLLLTLTVTQQACTVCTCMCVCCDLCWHFVMCVDSSGWITAFTSLRGNKAVGGIMIIVAILFTFCAVLSVILLKMVRLYSLLLIFRLQLSPLTNVCFYLWVGVFFVCGYKYLIIAKAKTCFLQFLALFLLSHRRDIVDVDC